MIITIKDYVQLCKPKIVALIVLTALVGMLVSSPTMLIDLDVLIFGNLGIALSASSAAIFNHVIDKTIDTRMRRTAYRPIAAGRVTSRAALLFAVFVGIIGFLILFLLVNHLVAWLTLFALVGYGLVYTLYLKRATAQNIVIGGLSGAAPPLLGWVAATGSIDADALLLVLIVFLWTPPHFWALAVYKLDEYQQSGLPMLPVTHGIECTRINILLYTILMVMACYLVYLVHFAGNMYLIGVTILNIRFLFLVYRLYSGVMAAYKNLFSYSISYLMWLFCILLLDKFFYVYFL